MLPVLICALVSLSLADNFDTAYPELEHYRTIYVQENGPQLSVVTEQSKVVSRRGGNATLPCKFHRDVSLPANPKLRIKWTKLTSDYLKERSYGHFHGRVYLLDSAPADASLVITELTLEDYGRYKCEVIDGLEDGTGRGVSGPARLSIVYPYFPRLGRYNLNFFDAERACREQDSIVASFDQLYEAWRGGLDWCNAGWLSDGSKDGAQIAKVGQMYAAWKLLGYDRCDAGWLADGSVRYPITRPRRRCSPTEAAVRFNGYPDKKHKLYGVYCFKGHN
ncbi:unnamed protein product [Coregonus sp. 'balchen']|nr:unnamed protein product [Coregonus sp. 'balchen']